MRNAGLTEFRNCTHSISCFSSIGIPSSCLNQLSYLFKPRSNTGQTTRQDLLHQTAPDSSDYKVQVDKIPSMTSVYLVPHLRYLFQLCLSWNPCLCFP